MKTLYHGTEASFEKFELQEKESNGHDFGFGLYFTETKRVAKLYGKRIYTVNFLGGKELSYDKVTITRNELKAFINSLENDYELDVLNNYNDVAFLGRDAVMKEALDSLLDGSIDNDNDIIHSFFGMFGWCSNKEILDALVKLGYDYTKAVYHDESIVYMVFNPEKIEIVNVETVKDEPIF